MTEKLKIDSIGQGTPLVFIHGWGLNSGIFEPMAARFTATHTVYNLNLPGFGRNQDVSVSPYDLSFIAELVARSIPDNAIIVGWSLGGLVAKELALHHSKKVKALVTITSSPCFTEGLNWPGITPSVLQYFQQQLMVNSEQTINNFLKIQAMGSSSVRQDTKAIKALMEQYPTPDSASLVSALKLLETVDLRCKISQIEVPFLRLYGRLDTLVPKDMISQMDKIAPNSDCYVFHHASHAPFISHSDEFYQVLNDWLAGNNAGS
ncbi:pimeloyl-ACP methyl ester esterase BioH [Thalassotalea aquiviva]|uniref:pimeloyl-ACP methyl ester esterase BioH n=1 Tax=Thalassotalea aquiviva TaxID=3242415 RepID=UPI00352AEFD9